MRVLSRRLLILALASLPGFTQAQGLWDNLNGQPGALALDNLGQSRPEAPFDITGTWSITGQWQFEDVPPLKPAAAELFAMASQAAAAGKSFNDDIGRCWPPGLPRMMTRVWPVHMIQLPTSIVMISNFMNQVRWIYMDGRSHSDPDYYVPSYNGESIGHWDGDTLVIDTRNFEPSHHWLRAGIPVSEEFHTIERIRMSADRQSLEVEWTMTDPQNWEGQWLGTKHYNRQDKVDFLEVHCLPDLNEGIIATDDEYTIRTED
ncbi:MAG: hypothetical protein RQ899_08910 [Pseudomonadales bacterium]|nr:hypothetical protein [Pseudomonadales bacterium]